jgi:molybdenum cofactor cytidylyltransferase
LIFGPCPIAAAEGALLAHGQIVGGVRWSKGRVLSQADLAAAAEAGLDSLSVARLEPGDLGEDAAAAALGAALAGADVRALAAVHGRCNLAAEADGVLLFDAGMVAAVNGSDEALTLGTLLPMARVAAGDIVATVKVIRYGVAEAALAAARAAAHPLRVARFRAFEAVLLATRLAGVSDKAVAKTARVTRARVEGLGGVMHEGAVVAHDVDALAAALRGAEGDMILVAGASATVDRGDVVPTAIVAAGGVVERLGMPVDPGNLLVLGRIGARPVIGLPGCARSPKHNGLDIVLERLVAGIGVTSADIAAMGAGGLLPEAERPDPQPRQLSEQL